MTTNLVLKNLRGFVLSRPPLIVFLIFLTVLAVTFVSFGIYVHHNHSLRDPKVAFDWNEFLERFAKIDFCLISSKNGTNFPTFNQSSFFKQEDDSDQSKRKKRFSFQVGLVIHPNQEFVKQASGLTHLSGSIYGFQLGFHGDRAKSARVDVSFQMRLANHKSLNASLCGEVGLLGSRRCPDVTVTTCVHLTGPSDAFPMTNQTPKEAAVCSPITSGSQRHARIEGHREIASSGWGAMPFCPSGPVVHTMYKLNPGLTVFLSAVDRARINSHLLNSSYFLLIIVSTVLCYAAVKGGKPPQDQHYHSVPLEA